MKRLLYKLVVIMLMVMFIVEPIFANPNRENGKSQPSASTPNSVGSGSPSPGSTVRPGTPGTSSTPSGPQKIWLVDDGNGGLREVEYVSEDIVPAGAIGYKSYKEDGSVDGVKYLDIEGSWLGKWIGDIADAIDQIVFRISLAIHPFPVSMFQLYGLTASRSNLHSVGLTMSPKEGEEGDIHKFYPDYLLISNNYYDSKYLKINKVTVTSNGASSGGSSFDTWNLPIAEGEGTGEDMFQFTKWKTIVMLFATCFAAEILFMAVYGYATGSSEDGDSSLMKNVAKKIAITLMLMVLVSALPFLLEAFRIGLFEIAESFYGEAAYRSYNELAVQGVISSWDIPVDSSGHMKDANIFKLPGLFLRSMRDMFVRTTSDPMDRALSKQMEKSNAKLSLKTLFIKLVVWLMITIYRFLMFFVTLKATIHIAKNVLEVYLLLSLVMILVPFSVFTPLKTIGSKCVMSLVSNLVECFIILVIIITIIPAIKVTVVNLLNYAIVMSIPGTSEIKATYQMGLMEDSHTLKLVTGDRFVVVFAETGKCKDKIAVCWTPKGADGSEAPGYTGNSDLQKVVKAEGAWVVMDISDLAVPTEKPYVKQENVRELTEITVPRLNSEKETMALDPASYRIIWSKNGKEINNKNESTTLIAKEYQPALAEIFAEGLLKTEATSFDWNSTMSQRESLTENIWISMVGTAEDVSKMMTGALSKLVDPDWDNMDQIWISTPTKVKEYSTDGNTMNDDQTTSLMFLQLTLVFLGLFLPSYFIQQSTQITNALMNGTAGMESLANAMEQTMSKTIGLTGRALGMPISLAGNIADAMNKSRENQAAANGGSSGNASQTRSDASKSTQQSIVDTNNKNK